MKKWAYDLVSTAFDGWMWAVVLAWPLFAVTHVGWRSLPLVGLPLFCAYLLGENRGYKRWKRLQAQLEGKKE